MTKRRRKNCYSTKSTHPSKETVKGYFLCPKRNRYFPNGTILSDDDEPVMLVEESTIPKQEKSVFRHTMALQLMGCRNPASLQRDITEDALNSISRMELANIPNPREFDISPTSQFAWTSHSGQLLNIANPTQSSLEFEKSVHWGLYDEQTSVDAVPVCENHIQWSKTSHNNTSHLALSSATGRGYVVRLIAVPLEECQSRSCLRNTFLFPNSGTCRGIAWAKGSDRLSVASDKGKTGHIISLLGDASVTEVVPSLKSDCFTQCFVDFDQVLLSGCRNGKIMSVDLRSRRIASQVARADGGSVSWIYPIADDTEILVSCTTSGSPALSKADRRMMATADGRFKPTMTFSGHVVSHRHDNIPGVDAAHSFISAKGEDGKLRIWNVQSGKCLNSMDAGESLASKVFVRGVESGYYARNRFAEVWLCNYAGNSQNVVKVFF